MNIALEPPSSTSTIRVRDLVVLPAEGRVTFDGAAVALTRREMEVLLALARRPDEVVRREDIYARVWTGSMRHRDRSVDVWVRKLREKLRTVAPEHTLLHTHYGFGYRLWPERD